MKKGMLMICLLVSFGSSYSQLTIDISKGNSSSNPLISKFIYGYLTEHLRRGIYDGFYVGGTSSIPNTYGVRNDIVAACINFKK